MIQVEYRQMLRLHELEHRMDGGSWQSFRRRDCFQKLASEDEFVWLILCVAKDKDLLTQGRQSCSCYEQFANKGVN
jgi:hypothetical protein